MSKDRISAPLDKSQRLERNDSVNLLSKMWLNSQESGSLLEILSTHVHVHLYASLSCTLSLIGTHLALNILSCPLGNYQTEYMMGAALWLANSALDHEIF